MYEGGKSDGPVVPANLPNNAVGVAAEVGEEGIGQGEHGRQNASRTQCRARGVQCAGACA